MSRNDLYFLLACAVVASMIAGNPAPRSSSHALASLLASPTTVLAAIDPDVLQDGLGQQ